VHLSGEPGKPLGKQSARVRRDVLTDFSRGDEILEVRYDAPRLEPGAQAILALGSIGRGKYDLVRNNCEHFATWCARGVRQSTQVRHRLQRAGSFAGAVGSSIPVAGLEILAVMLSMTREITPREVVPFPQAAHTQVRDAALWVGELRSVGDGLLTRVPVMPSPQHASVVGLGAGWLEGIVWSVSTPHTPVKSSLEGELAGGIWLSTAGDVFVASRDGWFRTTPAGSRQTLSVLRHVEAVVSAAGPNPH
jgi:Lecithin retinol acyltransferase